MLPKTVMRLIFVLIVMQHSLDAQRSVPESEHFRVETRLLGEVYCKGDADLYSVSFDVDVEIFNTSKVDIFLPKSMVPLGSKVADSIANAETEHYLFEESGTSIFPGNYQHDEALVRIEPGKSMVIHTGYHLFARYNPSFSYPKSVAAGSYAIVLVLGPEMLTPSEAQVRQIVVQLKTKPFIVRVPDKPNVIDCKQRKDRRRHRSH